ncbi:MAG TPA: SDR family oxidoreductase [Terriglobia bacterium]|nr:SDR family oxidoreductase [Terriglobia bacterium]
MAKLTSKPTRPKVQPDLIPNRFQNQVALVVGGARGIGKAIAVRLAREGALLVIADLDGKALRRTAREIAAEGGSVRTLDCDVRSEAQVNRMVAKAIRGCGRIDVLMQIAGVAKPAPFLKTTTKLFDWIVDTNVKGSFLVARAVVPHMIKQRRGKMVFMASTNSWDAEAELAPYNISKAGVYLLAKTLAREFGRYGIYSNALGPGFIRTRLSEWVLSHPGFKEKYETVIPLGRIGEPEDITGPATFLASRDSDFVNGVLLFVDGGQLA